MRTVLEYLAHCFLFVRLLVSYSEMPRLLKFSAAFLKMPICSKSSLVSMEPAEESGTQIVSVVFVCAEVVQL